MAKTQFLLLFYLSFYSPEFSNVYISIGRFRHVGFHAIDYLDIIFNTIKETLAVLSSEPLYKRGVCPIYKGTLEPFIGSIWNIMFFSTLIIFPMFLKQEMRKSLRT